VLGSLLSFGWYWLILPVAVAAIGILMVFRGLGHAVGGRGGKAVPRIVAGAPIAVIGLAFSLLGINTQTYARLTYEAPVADVFVKAVNPAQGIYQVTVARRDVANLPPQTCTLQGDEWEMGARVQKWKPWANVLGLDTTYTLDQIDNKYFDAARGNGKPITACDLKGPPPAVDQYVPNSWLLWLTDRSYTEDRLFGSASYMPLADGASFRVIMTQAGLNAEPTNDAAKKANAARP
jgi:hypothetical protein